MRYSFNCAADIVVRWASATPKEKGFIEEVICVTYERDRA